MSKLSKYLIEEKQERINTALRQKINKILSNMTSNHLFNEIPLDDIFNVFKKFGYMIVQEDGKEWSGFLTGAEGQASFDIATVNGSPVVNIKLHMTWYKYQTGRYEIVAYAM